ncbi:MAG: sensor histidine kinase [Leptospirales bacterium]
MNTENGLPFRGGPLPPDSLSLPPNKRILLLAGALFAGIFAIDAMTPQSLVVSILLDIPIALTGLTLRKKATITMVVLGLFANILAEVINARVEGTVNPIAVANRMFSAVSFFLVGYLTIRVQKSALEAGMFFSERSRATREQKIRTFLGEISAETDPESLLDQVAQHFVSLFNAKGAIIAPSGKDRWESPVHSSPPSLWSWQTGEALPGGLSLLLEQPFCPVWMSQLSLIPILENNKASRGVVGRLSIADPDRPEEKRRFLHLFILDPREPSILSTLGEMIPILEEVLHRLSLLRHLQEYNRILVRRNAIIRDLVYGVSHDIRTPLIANSMNMKLAIDGAWGKLPDEFASILGQTIHANDSILDLSNRLLLLSRYELNDLPMKIEPLRLDLIIQEVLTELSPLINGKSLNFSCALGPIPFDGDFPSMKRMILNLIDNAIKWSPPGGAIGVSCLKGESALTLHIVDEGPGIPEALIPNLFKRFGGMHAGSGFGLGLYIAQQIAKRHGGQIDYEPASPGSRFHIKLPLKENRLR